jgi:hypothetical protein
MEIMRIVTDNNEMNNIECSICNEYLYDGFTTSCCNQFIHKECLDKCRKTTAKNELCCPFCRNVKIIEVITVLEDDNNNNNNNNNNINNNNNVNYESNNNEIRFIMGCRCTICKVFIVNVIFILAVVSWLLTYQILANKRLLRGYRCNKYPYTCNLNITNITNITI